MRRQYERTLDDVNRALVQAKHKVDDIKATSQVFYFPNVDDVNDSENNIKLLDVDEDFIAKLEEGCSLIFKGGKDEKLVLCTEDKTYEVKEGEISNSLVLVPNLLFSTDVETTPLVQLEEKKIVGIFHKYLELRPTYARLNKLRSLLSEAAYSGPEYEDEVQNHGYFKSELVNIVQASDVELNEALTDMRACCIDGKWRLLNHEYESRMLSHIVSLLEEQSWVNFSINIREARSLLSSLMPEFILDYILLFYTDPSELDKNVASLREDKVCQCFAEMLLRTAEGKFRHNEFMMAWKQCLPEGMEANLNHLRGLALIEQEGLQQKIIHLFPESDLPENVAERFMLLFKRKEKWTLEEIEPYIKRLTTKNMNVNTLLTKYCRASTTNGVRMYGARHAK